MAHTAVLGATMAAAAALLTLRTTVAAPTGRSAGAAASESVPAVSSVSPPRLACYNGWNMHGQANLTLPAAMTAHLHTDIMTIYEAQLGNMPPRGPAQMLNGTGTWASNARSFIAAHVNKSKHDAAALVPQGWESLVVVDYESWKPLWAMTPNVSGSVGGDWLDTLATINSPGFDPAFLATVGFVPPSGAGGWPTLDASGRASLADAGWTHFSAVFFNATIDALRTVVPAAKVGFWNLPYKYYNDAGGGDPPEGWIQMLNGAGWLWSQLDVFLPDVYPERYAGPGSSRPLGLSARCGNISSANAAEYINGNVAVAQSLRAEWVPTSRQREVKVLLYTWWHYMCDQNTSFWADSVYLRDSFAATQAAGGDGVVLWGSVGSFKGEDHDPAVVAKFLSRDVAPLVEQYCGPTAQQREATSHDRQLPRRTQRSPTLASQQRRLRRTAGGEHP